MTISVAGAILLSAGVAATVAYLTIGQNRETARKRATLDVILNREWGKQFLELKKPYFEARDSDAGLAATVTATTPEAKKTLQEVYSYLNYFELIAVSMRAGILDEDFYKNWMKSIFIQRWHEADDMVKKLREVKDKPKLFEHFEALATKWEAED